MENKDIKPRSVGTGNSASDFDIRTYWHTIKKRRWIVVATLLTIVAFVTAWTLRRPRIYQAQAMVIIDPQAPNVLGGQVQKIVELGSNVYWGNREYYNTQFSILTGRTMAKKVVRKFRLHQDRRLLPNPKPGATEEALIDTVAADLQSRIAVVPKKESRVVAITIKARDPRLAADLANHVVDVYIEQNVEVKIDATEGATRWVALQLDGAKKDLDSSETKLYDFKREKNILSIDLEDQRNMISQALGEFSHAVTETKKARIDLQSRRNAVATLVAGDVTDAASTRVFETTSLDTLRDTYMEERRKLRALEERYGPKHNELAAQVARVTMGLTDLKSEAFSVLKSIDARLRALLETEQKYEAEVARLTQDAMKLSEQEKDYKQLSRDAANSEKIYGLLLTRLNESGLQQQDRSNNIRLLDEAREPRVPIEPNLRRSLGSGAALGLMFGLMLAFLVEFMDRSVKTQEDIESTLGVPFLGLVPTVDDPAVAQAGGPPEFYIVRHPNSTVAECCRVVRTNILFCSPDKPIKTLLVTSSNPVEGKTMTVIHLGITMAQSGHRTVIVDTDMRRPRLHKALRATNEVGASRVIMGECDIDGAVKSTDVPNLFIMPCGPIPPNPAELLQTEKFAALVRGLEEKFDRVIFDSPPILAVTDAALLSRMTDGVVLVVRAGRTTRDAVVRAKRLLDAVQARVVGAVLNDVNLKNPNYYYHYYHYYQSKYHDVPTTAGSEAVEKG